MSLKLAAFGSDPRNTTSPSLVSSCASVGGLKNHTIKPQIFIVAAQGSDPCETVDVIRSN